MKIRTALSLFALVSIAPPLLAAPSPADVTSATLLVVGVALVALVLFAPKGILGALRDRGAKWLP